MNKTTLPVALNVVDHPVGTRVLMSGERNAGWMYDTSIIEWSPSENAVKLGVGWIEPTDPRIREILPSPTTA